LDNFEEQANKYVEQAQKERGTKKIQCYVNAANQYILAKKNYQAAINFEKAADLYLQDKCEHHAAIHYMRASDRFSVCRSENPECIEKEKVCLNTSIILFDREKRYDLAAKNSEALALILKKERDYSNAITGYANAAFFHRKQHLHGEHVRCLLEAGFLLIVQQKYEDALNYLLKIPTEIGTIQPLTSSSNRIRSIASRTPGLGLEGPKPIDQVCGIYHSVVDTKISKVNSELFFAIGVLRIFLHGFNSGLEYLGEQAKFMLGREYGFLYKLIGVKKEIGLSARRKAEKFDLQIKNYTQIFTLREEILQVLNLIKENFV